METYIDYQITGVREMYLDFFNPKFNCSSGLKTLSHMHKFPFLKILK